MTRVTTARSDWNIGVAIPSLPTGETYEDENGDEQDVYQPPLFIGLGASEFPGDDDTPPSGRIYTEYNFNELHLDYLDAQGVVTITRPGTFDGDEYPFTEEEL